MGTRTSTPAPALKEWAVVVDALLAGEQVVDLRKGGIREDRRTDADGRTRRRFGLAATRCWLYPTIEHQRPELLDVAYRHRVDLADGSPVGEPITVRGWADIVEVGTIDDAERVDAVAAKSIWTSDYATSRLHWKARDPIWVLLVRAYLLEEPRTVPWRDAYGGCTSWVTLEGVPADPGDLPSRPALSDDAFAARARGVREALGAGVLGVAVAEDGGATP